MFFFAGVALYYSNISGAPMTFIFWRSTSQNKAFSNKKQVAPFRFQVYPPKKFEPLTNCSAGFLAAGGPFNKLTQPRKLGSCNASEACISYRNKPATPVCFKGQKSLFFSLKEAAVFFYFRKKVRMVIYWFWWVFVLIQGRHAFFCVF